MKIDIPRNTPWRQNNKGDYSSAIWSSRNIDLKTNPGAVRPSHKMIKTTDSTSVDTIFVEADDGTVTWGATKNGLYASVFVEPNGTTPPTVQQSWTVSGTNVSSLTKSITVPAGTNQTLVVYAFSADTVSATTDGVSSITYDSVSLNGKASSNTSCGDNVRVRYSLQYADAPTQTTADVVVTYAGSVPNAVAHIILLENTSGVNPLNDVFKVDTTTGGATSLGFDADGDPIPSSGYANHLLIASCVSSDTSHTQTGIGATQLQNETVGTVRASTYTMGDVRYNSPQDLSVAFAKATGSINSVSTMRWWTLAGNGIYQTSSENGDFETDDAGTLPTITSGKEEGDLKSFNSRLYLAYDTNLYRRTSALWTTVDTGLSPGYKILETYFDRLYIASEDDIVSINTAEVVATTSNTLDLRSTSGINNNLNITCMRRVSNGLWIGTQNQEGGNARMLFWDGETQDTVELDVEIDSAMVMAMTVKDDVPYIVDERGDLRAWNGSFFQKVDEFDFDDIQLYRFDQSSNKDRWIHHNGMLTVDDEILMAVNTRPNDTNDSIPVRHSSGVYAWSPETGIYMKHAYTAQEDSATITDYGQCKTPEVGALFRLSGDTDNENRTDQSDFFAGYSYESDNSTTVYAISKSDKRGLDMNSASRDELGMIITGRIRAEDVQDALNSLYLFHKQLANSTDRFIVTYRTAEYTPSETDITWVNTTSFTSTDASWAEIKTNFDADVEYEFEGLSGDGAGMFAMITDISESGGTYTVTLDQTITGATTNTASARIDRWRFAGEFTDSDGDDLFSEFSPEGMGTWAQFRVVMWGEDMELERLLLKSSNAQSA